MKGPHPDRPRGSDPQGEKIAGQDRSGNDYSALRVSQRPWPAKTLILLLRRDFSGEREIAEIWPVHQHVFPVAATTVILGVILAPKFHSLGEGAESLSYSPPVVESFQSLPNLATIGAMGPRESSSRAHWSDHGSKDERAAAQA